MDSVLVVTKHDGSTITIGISEGNMFIQEAGERVVLNNANTTVEGLTFQRRRESGCGINPERVDAEFGLSTHSENGVAIAQDFFTVVYCEDNRQIMMKKSFTATKRIHRTDFGHHHFGSIDRPFSRYQPKRLFPAFYQFKPRVQAHIAWHGRIMRQRGAAENRAEPALHRG